MSIEHHDNGGRPAGSGRGVVPEPVIAASIALDALLLRGDLAELKAAGIRFRAGTEAAITRELRRSRSTATTSSTTTTSPAG